MYQKFSFCFTALQHPEWTGLISDVIPWHAQKHWINGAKGWQLTLNQQELVWDSKH